MGNVSCEEGAIPAESDYFRVKVPSANNRELRCAVDAVRAAAKKAPPLPQLQRPRHSLDELRRVEAATKEAIEQEVARRKAEGPEPIRTRSDTVFLDSLSDDEN